MSSFETSCQLSRAMRQTLFVLMTVMLTLVNIGHTDETNRADQLAKIERAITSGAGFLVEQQDVDGTWRSKTYGLLKDGTSLTPLVLWSLPKSTETRTARERGIVAMSLWVASDTQPVRVRVLPQYPVYCAGLAIQALTESHTKVENMEVAAWRELLINYQLTERNSWSRKDPQFGGWSYSHEPRSKSVNDATLSPLDEPNLSATVFALEGLMAAQNEDQRRSACQWTALQFVHRCQNWRENASVEDAKFNDGGFHFLLRDEIRNKPGVAGVDCNGETRFLSYGSATADGLRALLLCGVKPDHPRVIAARRWLVQNFTGGAHPGTYPANRVHLQPSLDFYYLASVTSAFRQIRIDEPPLSEGRWAMAVASRLLNLQLSDGSWSNPAVDVREDDPLIATSFALRALRDCLSELH